MPKSRIEYNFLLLFKDNHYEYDFKKVPENLIGDKTALIGFYKTTALRLDDIYEIIPKGPVDPAEDEDIPGTHKRRKTPNLYSVMFSEQFETIVEAWDMDHAEERFEEEELAGDEERRRYLRSELDAIEPWEAITSTTDENLQETNIHRIAYPDPPAVFDKLIEYLASEAMDDPLWHLEHLYAKFADELFGEGYLNKLNELKSRYYGVFKELMHAEWRKLEEETDADR